MATVSTNILVGAVEVDVSNYVTAGGAGSFSDFGHHKTPVEFSPNWTNYEVRSERAYGPIKIIPIDANFKLKVALLEGTCANQRIIMRQPSGNLTGTPPNLTLLVGAPVEQYHQIKMIAPGLGTGLVSTYIFWKCLAGEAAAITYGKSIEQVYEVTFTSLFDDSVATGDKFYKRVDS